MLTYLLVIILVVTQFVLVFTWPIGIAYITLLVGHLPIKFGGSDTVNLMGMGTMSVSTLRIFGLWLALFLFIVMNINKLTKYFSIYWLHLLFLLFFLISLFWGPSIGYGLRTLAKLSLPLMFMMLILVSINDIEQLKKLSKVMIVGALISICLALILQSLNTGSKFTVPGMSASPFSAHLVVVSMLVAASYIREKKTVLLVILILLIFAIISAFTRITIGGMFAGMSVLLFLALHGMARFILPIVGVLGLPALFLLSDKFRNRMFIHGDDINASSFVRDPAATLDQVHGSGRFDAWQTVLDLFFIPSPLIGSGGGATQHYFYTGSYQLMGVIHSEYVRLLSEVGIIGLIIFIAAIISYLIRLLSIYRKCKGTVYADYPLAAIAAIVSYVIYFATDNGIDYVLQFGCFVFALIGMGEKAWWLYSRDEVDELEMSQKISKKEKPVYGKKLQVLHIKKSSPE